MIVAAQPHLVSESGQTVVITNGFPAPLDSCIVTFGPVQTGNGDPSPSNIRTISGRTGLSVYVSPTSSGGTKYPVSWSEYGTVYGGTLDIVSGLLTVTHKSTTFDGSTTFDVLNSGRFVVVTQDDMLPGNHYADPKVLVDKFIKVELMGNVPDSVLDVRVGADSNKLYFYHFDTALNLKTKSAIKSWFAQNPTTYTYPLADPITYQLTPKQISTIRGENHIRSDAGDISATYYAI